MKDYTCPKHGTVSRMNVTIGNKQSYYLEGDFCMKCYAEMIENNCERVEIK